MSIPKSELFCSLKFHVLNAFMQEFCLNLILQKIRMAEYVMSNGNYRGIIGLCLGFSGNPTVRNILFSTVCSNVIWSSEFLKYTHIHIWNWFWPQSFCLGNGSRHRDNFQQFAQWIARYLYGVKVRYEYRHRYESDDLQLQLRSDSLTQFAKRAWGHCAQG